MNLVFTMAGAFSRFRLFGNKIPKYLYPLGSVNVLSKVIENIISCYKFKKIFLIANRNEQLFDPVIRSTIKKFDISEKSLIYIDDTSSQLETTLTILDYFNNREMLDPICFANIDTIVSRRKKFFVKLNSCGQNEALIDAFSGQSTNYSYIRHKNDQLVTEVIDKKIISLLACSGLYGFGSFKEMARKANLVLGKNVNANFTGLYNEYIENNHNVYFIANNKRHDTIVLGTPEEYILNLHKFEE